MDKRDLGTLVRDANWSKLHEVIENASDTKARSTMGRLIDVFADMRLDWYYRHPKEVYILLKFIGGQYIECLCIENTYHMKRYIKQVIPSLTEEDVEKVKERLYKEKIWANEDIELRLEHHQVYSA